MKYLKRLLFLMALFMTLSPAVAAEEEGGALTCKPSFGGMSRTAMSGTLPTSEKLLLSSICPSSCTEALAGMCS